MRLPLATAAFCAGVIACAGGESSTTLAKGPAQIIENERPQREGDQTWRVDTSPLLTIGAGEGLAAQGDTMFEFNEITGAFVLSDGRIVVADMGSSALRFYSEAGAFLTAVGRKGDGPGEFRQIMGFHRVRGDTLVVNDNLAELDWFAPDGGLIKSGSSGGDGAGPVQVAVILSDGTPIAVELAGFEQRGPYQERKLTIQRVDARRARVDSLVTLLASQETPRRPGVMSQHFEFTPLLLLEGAGELLVTANTAVYQLDLRDRNGALIRSIRRSATPDPITPAMKSQARERGIRTREEGLSPDDPRWIRKREAFYDSDPFPDRLPLIHDIVATRSGELWVRQYDAEHELTKSFTVASPWSDRESQWDVFSADGRWITTVQLPGRFTLLDATEDRVLGLTVNDDDEQGVRVLRLVKP